MCGAGAQKMTQATRARVPNRSKFFRVTDVPATAAGQEILVVDGDEQVVKGLDRLLTRVGLTVTGTGDHGRARDQILNKYFAVALLDVDTPTPGGGLELLAVRARQVAADVGDHDDQPAVVRHRGEVVSRRRDRRRAQGPRGRALPARARARRGDRAEVDGRAHGASRGDRRVARGLPAQDARDVEDDHRHGGPHPRPRPRPASAPRSAATRSTWSWSTTIPRRWRASSAC